MTVKELLIFAAGAVTGGVSTYLFVRNKIEKRAFEYAEDRIRQMEEYYDVSDEYLRKPEEESEETEEDEKLDRSSIVRGMKSEKIPYNKYYNHDPNKMKDPAFMEHPLDQGEPGEEDLGFTIDKEAEEQHRRDMDRPPERVSEDSLGDIPSFYSEEIIFYYMYDEVFTDENEVEIHDPMLLFGEEFINSHFMDNDDSVAYIRNYEQDCLYEIQKVWASFDETR